MTKALIAGGGIAGPVTAMALQRAGIEAVVYEAHRPGADDAGSYLTVATNGLDALRAIGADRPVLEAGFPTPTNVLLSGSGRRLGAVSNGGWPTGPSATPSSGPGCTGPCARRRPPAASPWRTAGAWSAPR